MMPKTNYMPTRAPALYILVGMIIGLCTAKEVEAPQGVVVISALILSVAALRLSMRHNRLWLVSFMAAATLTFWVYGSLRLPTTPESDQLGMPIREAKIQFVVERILQDENIFSQLSGIGRIVSASSTSRLKAGAQIYFRVKNLRGMRVIRGQELSATGILQSIPQSVKPDSFESYLKKINVHYRFYRFSEYSIIQEPSYFESFCQEMNHQLVEYLSLGAPEESTLKNIYIAMLLGRKAELSDRQRDRFKMTGTMHFFAISGLHIGVIATVIAQFLTLVRVPRRLSPLIGLPLLFLYVEITGASPSAVRAFLMAAFFWASFAFARQRSPLAALSASAVFVLIFKPDQLWSIGFQLSYTVVLSILLFGLPLYRKLSERFAVFAYLPHNSWAPWQHLLAWLQDKLFLLFAISLSAWLASAPLSAGFFGFISPGAVILNMLLVNLAAIAITTGVIAVTMAITGLEFIATFLNHGAWLAIYVMDLAVMGSLKIPGMILICDGFPKRIAYATLAIYFTLLWLINQMRSSNNGLCWILPPSLVVAALIYGVCIQ